MGIAKKAPRGGLAEKLAGAPRVLILRNAEIERFEDEHKSIFEIWDGFVGRREKPNSTQVRDLVALGLVGGGMTDEKADQLLENMGPDHLPQLYQIAQALVGVAFTPDMAEAGNDEPAAEDDGGDTEKKT